MEHVVQLLVGVQTDLWPVSENCLAGSAESDMDPLWPSNCRSIEMFATVTKRHARTLLSNTCGFLYLNYL